MIGRIEIHRDMWKRLNRAWRMHLKECKANPRKDRYFDSKKFLNTQFRWAKHITCWDYLLDLLVNNFDTIQQEHWFGSQADTLYYLFEQRMVEQGIKYRGHR